jgi:hypothetical protein
VHGGETGVGVGLASLKVVEMAAGVMSAGRKLGNRSFFSIKCAGECLQAPSSKTIGLRPRNVTLIYVSLLTMVDVQGLEGSGTDGKPRQAAKSRFSLRIGQP